MKNANQNILQENYPFSKYKMDYLLTYFSFGYINPTVQQFRFLSVSMVIVSFFIFVSRKKKFDAFFNIIVIVLFIILAVQMLMFGNFNVKSFVGTYLIWFLPYFIIVSVGPKYFRLFVNIFYFFVIISFIFWIPSNLSDSFHQGLADFIKMIGTDPDSNESFIIYNIDWHRLGDVWFIKNPGPFNEGGVFSCFLILALFLNTVIEGNLWNKKNIVFVAGIISTTSTAGFIALFIFISAYYLMGRGLKAKLIIFPLILFGSFCAYNTLGFLKEKIITQYQSQMRLRNYDVRIGRFYSAKVTLGLIKRYPIFGKGLFKKDRYLSKREEEIGISGSLNGLVDFAAKYGLVLWGFYFYFFYIFMRSIMKYNGFKIEFALLALFPILAVGSAQNPFLSPAYLIISYSGFYFFRYHSFSEQ